MDGIVTIHGKEYRTVAYRVNEFRERFPLSEHWGILTEIVSADDERVVMKATIKHEDTVVGTGYAEEARASSAINRTSALENCETSAIGRALAACGLAGTEYASANEVEGAISSQDQLVAEKVAEAKLAMDKEDWAALCRLDKADDPIWMAAWKKLNAQQKRIKELIATRATYADEMTAAANNEDWGGFTQLNDELTKAQARLVCVSLEGAARDKLIELRSEETT